MSSTTATPRPNATAAIRADETALTLIKSCTRVGRRFHLNGRVIDLYKEVQKLGHKTSRMNFSKALKSIEGVAPAAPCPRPPKRARVPKAVKLHSTQKDAPSVNVETADAIAVEPEPQSTRFSIVRNVSRSTGRCSWGVFDDHPFGGSPAIVYVGENLKETLLEAARLNRPAEKICYTKHGQVGIIENKDDED